MPYKTFQHLAFTEVMECRAGVEEYYEKDYTPSQRRTPHKAPSES